MTRIRGGPCCRVDDCDKVKPGEVSIPGSIYRVRKWGATFPIERTMLSEDDRFWMCLDEMDVGSFFVPRGGV